MNRKIAAAMLIVALAVSGTAIAETRSYGDGVFRQDDGWPTSIEMPPPADFVQPVDQHVIEVRAEDTAAACGNEDFLGCEGDDHDLTAFANRMRIMAYLQTRDPGLWAMARAEFVMWPHATLIVIPKTGPESYLQFMRFHEIRHGAPHFWRHPTD